MELPVNLVTELVNLALVMIVVADVIATDIEKAPTASKMEKSKLAEDLGDDLRAPFLTALSKLMVLEAKSFLETSMRNLNLFL